MPEIRLLTNCELNKEERSEFRIELSAQLANWLNKPESYCMVVTQFETEMTFGGRSDPAASVEIASLGLPEECLPQLTKSICSFLENSLKLNPARVYIRFVSPPRTHWGWNGKTFA